MFSTKRHLPQDTIRNERPFKRPAQVIVNGEDPTQYYESFLESSASEVFAKYNGVEAYTTLPINSALVDNVCFGMVCGVKTQFLDDPSIATIQPGIEIPTSRRYLLLIVLNRIHMLQTSDGKEIGVLNTQTSTALQELERRFQIKYTVYVAVDEWTTKLRSFRTMGKSTCLDVEIHFFGSTSNSTAIGRILSDSNHFLQPPDFLDSSIPYDNPHEIKFSSITEPELSLEVPNSISSSTDGLSVDMTATVLDNLDHIGSLAGWDIDKNVIRTELKLHQREALDFIAQREAPSTSETFSLFKKCTDCHNRTYYEHSVIGSRRPVKQLEDFGGIIADEMGLGKTLTMIAAIAMSATQAHQFKYHDTGDSRMLVKMKRARATLVLCPSVLLMDGWMEEVSKHIVPRVLHCIKYHGASKPAETELLDTDIVLTTYATLIADSTRNGVLHTIHWFRIILDEAHSIRHQRTKQFRAVVALSAKHRWCLTGTPIQNSLDDLGALVRFLRVPQLDGPSDFNSYISRPVENRHVEGLRRLRELLQSICLRRLKDLLNLSKPDSSIELVQLTTEERNAYCRIGEDHRRAIDRAIERGNLADASSGLFRAILQLRLFCNSGLCVDPERIDSCQDEDLSPPESGPEGICSYCSCDVNSANVLGSAGSGAMLSCLHTLCMECLDRSERAQDNLICCVVCSTVCSDVRFKQEKVSTLDEFPLRLMSRSSKLEALAYDIARHQGEKCIVFSSWRKSIALVASYLAAYNISVCVVDGSLTLPERRSKLLQFQKDPNINALLMTLGTGAVGLNLTVANRVHILEPQWNPSIEKQAIGRVMRLGQEKQVAIVRYIVEHTVEQHIQTRQEKKLHLARLGWDSNKAESDDEKLQKVIAMKSLLSIE